MIERLLKQTEYIDFESNTYKAPKTLNANIRAKFM